MSQRDNGATIKFSVLVDTNALSKICVYICNEDTSSSSRYFVGIVGDTPEFGNWNPEKCVNCKFAYKKSEDQEVWECDIPKTTYPSTLRYRYFVAEWRIDVENESNQKKMVVLAWESRLKPRIFDFSIHSKTQDAYNSAKFGQYENGLYIQRGYLMSHSELRVRLSGLALKLSKNAIPGLSSSTRDLTKLSGRRVYVTCRQSIVEENGVLNALDCETAIYPNASLRNQQVTNSSSHLIQTLEKKLAAEIRSQLIDNPEPIPHRNSPPISNDIPNIHVIHPNPRMFLNNTHNSRRNNVEFASSPFSSRNSTCPPTPRSLSPAQNHIGEPPVFVSVLAKKRCTRHLGEHTGCWGTLYTNGDDVTFYIETDNAEDTSIELEFYVEVPQEDDDEESALPPVKFLGSAFFGPFTENWGQKGAQLLSRRRTLMGDVRISYMVINPIFDGPEPTLKVSYKHYWKTRGALEIGHRGMGTYYLSKESNELEKPAQVKENTLRSFQAAVNHGADFVEMDVQLTKDHQVVVYHDFETVITPRKKRRGELKNLSVAVKDLPYDALRELRLQHSSVLTKEQTSEELDGEDLDPIELQHFPLLRDCLEHVDSDLGFDIEIKYPLELKTTGSEMTNFFERNMYVDTILREIYKYAGNRRILLSCFDPDTCAMLQSKQNYFPVFQLGVEKDYTDIRHQTFENLCYSAKANELLGIAVNGTDILENPANAEFARSLGLILLCWGSSANSSENMERLKSLGVHGLIYDRMQEHKVSGTISSLKSAKLLSISAQQGLDVMHTNSSLENHSWNLESNATITRCNSLGLFKNNNYHIDKINFPAETCFNEAVKSQNDNDDDGGSEQDTPPSTPLIERHRKNTATFEFEDNFAAHLNFNDVKPITTSTKLA